MRSRILLASALVALLGATIFPQSAHAGGYHRAPSGWGETRTVRHHVYYPRYRHVVRVHARTDPYTYRYQPRGYYPYYNSGYWRPTHIVRKKRARYYRRKPRYHKSWGAKKRAYRNRKWHAEHHGRHYRGHW